MKILIYTDSRGLSFHDRFKSQRFQTYSEKLSEIYDVDAFVDAWQSIVGLFDVVDDFTKYDKVILHAGLIDIAPRHHRTCKDKIYVEYKDNFDEIFGEEEMDKHLNTYFPHKFRRRKTTNMFTVEKAEECLIPRLQKIPNILWILSNRYVHHWPNCRKYKYHPKRINETIMAYEELYKKHFDVIDLTKWTDEEIKKYTYDNVHFTKEGNDLVYNMLIEKLGN